ncbi:hypothetical protein [Streptomyces chartreusis]|uniref:hypothetical protein n=1 Tax=Streptomyces chartreusis TaxID=1969 RepID=UPI002E189B24
MTRTLTRPTHPSVPGLPFAGQQLEVWCGALSRDPAPRIYVLDDGTRMPATSLVFKLLEGSATPLPDHPRADSGTAASSNTTRFHTAVGGRGYHLDVAMRPGTSHARVIVGTDPTGAPTRLSGIVALDDLQAISDLFAVAHAAHLPSLTGPVTLGNNDDARSWSAAQDTHLIARYRAGADCRTLALELDRSARSVRRRLHQLGLAPSLAAFLPSPRTP